MPISLCEGVYNKHLFFLQDFVIISFVTTCHKGENNNEGAWPRWYICHNQKILSSLLLAYTADRIIPCYRSPPLILIELLNFYGILSEGFLISVFGQRGSKKNKKATNKPAQFPFFHRKFVVFLHHCCSLPLFQTLLGQKMTTEKD